MNSSHDQPQRMGLWAVLLCSVFAWSPTLYPGYWQTLDGFTPLFNAGLPNSIARVATSADLWRGSGNGAFLFAQPFLALGLEPWTAIRLSFALMITLGGLGVYIWLRPRLGDRPAGLAAVIYMFMPPVLATVYVRGSVSDMLVLALIPLALAGLAIYTEDRSLVAAAVAVVAILWMWRTQAGLAALGSVVLILYAILVERQRLTILIASVASAAGMLSLVPLWNIRAPAPVTFADHFVYFYQLLRPTWSVAPSMAGWQDGFPFQVGVTVFAFAVVGGWGFVALRSPLAAITRRLLLFCFLGAGVILLLTLGVSEPLWKLSSADRLLTYPWQATLLAAPLLAAAAGSLAFAFPGLQQPISWSGLIVVATAASFVYLAPTFTSVTPPRLPLAVVGDNVAVVLSADLTEQAAPRQATLTITWQALRPFDADDNIFFQALTRDSAPKLVAQLDEQPVLDRPASEWQPGEIFTEEFTLALPAATEGPLQYFFGFYDWRTGERRPIDSGLDNKMVFYGR